MKVTRDKFFQDLEYFIDNEMSLEIEDDRSLTAIWSTHLSTVAELRKRLKEWRLEDGLEDHN